MRRTPDGSARRTASRRACSGSTPAARASATRASMRSPSSSDVGTSTGVPGPLGPVEHLVGEQQCWQSRGQSLEDRGAFFLHRLHRLPQLVDRSSVGHGDAPEDVRVAAPQLVDDPLHDLVEGELDHAPRRSPHGNRSGAAGRRALRAGGLGRRSRSPRGSPRTPRQGSAAATRGSAPASRHTRPAADACPPETGQAGRTCRRSTAALGAGQRGGVRLVGLGLGAVDGVGGHGVRRPGVDECRGARPASLTVMP